jgi:DNA uptake protein ComE-like DNA-binding protein
MRVSKRAIIFIGLMFTGILLFPLVTLGHHENAAAGLLAQNDKSSQREMLPPLNLDLEEKTESGEEKKKKEKKAKKAKKQSNVEDTDAARLTLPDFEAEEKSDTAEDSEGDTREITLEEVLADSEAMRLEFEEKLRRSLEMLEKMETQLSQLADSVAYYRDTVVPDLKSDSQQLQKRIVRLLEVNKKLRRQLTSDTPPAKETLTPDTDQQPEGKEMESSPTRLLNPNRATLEELKAIESLSPRLAGRIEWYREHIRRFKSRKDLRRVPGIDSSVFEAIKNKFQPGAYE